MLNSKLAFPSSWSGAGRVDLTIPTLGIVKKIKMNVNILFLDSSLCLLCRFLGVVCQAFHCTLSSPFQLHLATLSITYPTLWPSWTFTHIQICFNVLTSVPLLMLCHSDGEYSYPQLKPFSSPRHSTKASSSKRPSLTGPPWELTICFLGSLRVLNLHLTLSVTLCLVLFC